MKASNLYICVDEGGTLSNYKWKGLVYKNEDSARYSHWYVSLVQSHSFDSICGGLVRQNQVKQLWIKRQL